jgi:formyltetrahydrofolate-dependent phosphoribosylglycinamide formyltransferase
VPGSSSSEPSRRRPGRLVVLASGSGTILQALLDAAANPAYGALVVAVCSDRAGIPALDRARAAGAAAFVVSYADYVERDAWDEALTEAVAAYEPDLVVSAGFLRILGPRFLARFPNRIVNTHPALLPAFPGTRAVRDALDYGAKVTGVTVHVVDEGVDTGPVVAQAAVPVLEGDDEETLHERIKSVERALVVEVVGRLIRQGFQVDGRRVVVR